jgi:hypothetical protein
MSGFKLSSRLQQLMKHGSPWMRSPGGGVSQANTYETSLLS